MERVITPRNFHPRYDRHNNGLWVGTRIGPPVLGYDLWLDPTNGITSAANIISAWVERAHGATFVVSGGSGLRTGLNTKNGRNVVEVNGNTQQLGATIAPLTNQGTYYGVIQITASDDQGSFFATGGANNYFPIVGKSSTNEIYAWDGTHFVTGSFPSLNTTYYLVTFKVSAGVGTLYRNGTSVATNTWNASVATTAARLGNNGTSLRCKFGDQLWYPTAHSDADRNLIEAFLINQWAL